VYCPPPQIYFVDKDTGTPLAGGKVYFYEDQSRSVLKTVYQQVQQPDKSYNFVALNNPVVLTSVGTFADNDGDDIDVYMYPYATAPGVSPLGAVELYYIEVYSSGDVLQFTREAFPPNLAGDTNDLISFAPSVNELTNPQFVEINFVLDPATSAYTYTVGSGETIISIAPSWDLVVTAGVSGTITLSQIGIADGSLTSNPPYSLQIGSTGLSSIILRQQLSASPNLLYNAAGESAISSTMLVKSVSPSGDVGISMTYEPSTGTAYTLANGTATNTFGVIKLTTLINQVENTTAAPTGYTNVDISWLANSTIQITSLQIVGVQNEGSSVEFLQQSTALQQSGLAYYYKPQLEYKPIPSYTVGWDFKNNPCQELGTTVGLSGLAANLSRYIADQTIAFEEITNTTTYVFDDGGLHASPTLTTQLAFIQYLPTPEAYELIHAANLSVQIKGGLNAVGYVSLYYTTGTLPDITANASVVTALTDGIPTVASGWTIIENPLASEVGGLANHAAFAAYDGLATNSTIQSLSGWESPVTGVDITPTFFAIVVSFESVPPANTGNIPYITLCSGDMPTAPIPMTRGETLQALEYYYETSYDYNVPVGSTSSPACLAGALERQMIGYTSGADTNWGAAPFGITYNSIKVNTPAVSFYTPLGVAGNLRAAVYTGGASAATADASITSTPYWTAANAGNRGVTYDSVLATVAVNQGADVTPPQSGNVTFHYIADARLGTY
jgi:hypothetical protein